MGKFVLCIAFLFSSFYVFSQTVFSFSAGLGTFVMKEMKYHQEDLAKGFPVKMEVTENFPAFVVYEAAVSTNYDNNLYGIFAGFGSTGGRIHYADYSGEIGCNLFVRYFEFGALVKWQFPSQEGRVKKGLALKPSAIFGQYSLDVFAGPLVGSQHEVTTFNSINVGLQPQITLERVVYKKIGIAAFLGFNFNVLKGNLFLENDDSRYLLNSKGSPVKLDWTGLRVGPAFRFLLNNIFSTL